MNPRLFAVCLLVALCGCHSKVAFLSNDTSDAVKRTIKVSASSSTATRLKVHESFGSITTTSRTGNGVDVTAEVSVNGQYPKDKLQPWLDKAKVEIATLGSTITVQLKRPDGMPKDMSLYASYKILVPPSFEQELHSDNGAISITGPSRAVDASSSFGEIRVAKVEGGVKAKSSNGAVSVDDARGDVDAHSSFGEIRLKSIHGRVTAHSDNGAVSADDIDGDVKSGSSFGEIRVTNIRGALTGSTNNGTLNAKEVHAAGKDVSLTSSFGQVDFAGEAGGLTMHSDNGSLSADLPILPRQVNMSSSFGEVKLSLPRNAGADVEAGTDFGSVKVEGFSAPAGEKKRWTGRIGSGGSTVKLKSNNGSIILKAR